MLRVLRADLADTKYMNVLIAALMVTAISSSIFSDMGQYHAADRSVFWLAHPILAVYLPLALILADAQEEGRQSRLATLAGLPVGRVRLGMSRYFMPLMVQIVVAGVAWSLILAWSVGRDWYYGADGGALWKQLTGWLENMSGLIPSYALLGLGALAVPLLLDDLFPRARAKTWGAMAIILSSTFISGSLTYLGNGLWISRIGWVAVIALVLTSLEILVFSRRSAY